MSNTLIGQEVATPTGRLGRLWRMGRSGLGMARAVVGSRDTDLEAITQMTTRLGELRGIAMKVGQIVAYVDPSLPPELRTMLSLLQSQAPASPWSAVEQTLREDLGLRADALLPRMGRTPIAVASIGQVHRARLADGTELAVKIQHPGVANALRTDFNTATTGAVFARLMPGGSSVRGLIDEARTAMLEECDFTLEASRQRAFATFFANHSMLAIPHVIDATPRVLMTEWLPGRSLDAFLATNPRQVERDRIGTALFELFIGTLYRHGQLHADPHPGNFAIADDGRVVIYDFGCVRRFDPAVVAGLRDLLAAVRTDDLDAMAAGLEAIGGTAPSKPAVRDHMRTLLRSFFAPLLVDGPHAIDAGASLGASDVLADKRALLGLALPGSLLFLLRLRFGLYAVLARLGAIADWAALEHAYVIENDQVLPTMSLADPHALHRH